jgi:hypothetical protein
MKHPHRSASTLMKMVERLFLREILTFEGERHVGIRVEGSHPDRSVFAVARLDGCETVVVARVYEAELDNDPARALHIVYMGMDDLALVARVTQPSFGVQGRN